jgi:hypothetical protein
VAWAEPITTVITDVLQRATEGSTTSARSSYSGAHQCFNALTHGLFVVAVFLSCIADVVCRLTLTRSTSGSEWQCFVQLWSPWGVRRVPKTFPKIKPVIDLSEEIR